MKIDRQKWYARVAHTPRVGQRAMDEAAERHRFIGYFAFPRAGKSYGAARHVEPLLLEPNRHVWIVAPTYKLGAKEFGYIWNDLGTTGWLARATHKYFDARNGNMRIEFPWGSFVEVISADNQVALRAEEVDVLLLAEASALDGEIFERHLLARVEKRQGTVLVPTTPKGRNWVYERFRLPSLRTLEDGSPNPDYDPAFWSAVVSADPELGDIYEPGIYDPESIARMKRLLPYPIYCEQVGGDFASYAGLIYGIFDPRVHEIEPVPIQPWWTHVVGYDHGAADPTAIILMSWDPQGTLHAWGEYYIGDKPAGHFAQWIRTMLGPDRAPTAISTDPSARQVRVEFANLGIATTYPVDRDVSARIVRVNQLLGDHKLKIHRGRCPNLSKQIRKWEWDEKRPGKPRLGQEEHALDALGYGALIPVGLPREQDARLPGADPYAPLGEDPLVSRLWRDVRKRAADYARQQQDETDEGTLYGTALGEADPEMAEFVEAAW